jgi:hypothetical protein
MKNFRLIGLVVSLLVGASCSHDVGSTLGPAPIPPATDPDDAIQAPDRPQIEVSAVTDRAVVIDWRSTAPGPKALEVFIATTPLKDETLSAADSRYYAVASGRGTIEIEGLTAGSRYFFRARTLHDQGVESDASNMVVAVR